MKSNRNSRRNVARLSRAILVMGLAAMLESAAAQSVSRLGNVDFAVDDAGVHVGNVDLGGHYPFGAYMARIGVPMQTTPSPASIATDDAGTTMGLWRDGRDNRHGFKGEASVVEAGGRIRTVGDASWRFDPWRVTRVELLAAGDLVSDDAGVAYGFVGSSVARKLGDDVTAEALVGVQSFTDGNERLHLRASVLWEALPRYGINVQWRWREYASRNGDASAAYFNPGAYSENQLAAGIRTRFGAWTLSAALAGGVETVNASEARPVSTAELRGEAALGGKLRLAVYAGYDRSLRYGEASGNASSQVGARVSQPF